MTLKKKNKQKHSNKNTIKFLKIKKKTQHLTFIVEIKKYRNLTFIVEIKKYRNGGKRYGGGGGRRICFSWN